VVPPPQGCKDRNEVEPGGGPTEGNAQISFIFSHELLNLDVPIRSPIKKNCTKVMVITFYIK
jgi:hypothetical protein